MDSCDGKIACGLILSVEPANEKMPLNGRREGEELRREGVGPGSGRVEPRNEGVLLKSEMDMNKLGSSHLNHVPANVNQMLPQTVDRSSRSCDQSHDALRCNHVSSVPANGGWDYLSEHSDSGDRNFRSRDQSLKHSRATSEPASKGAVRRNYLSGGHDNSLFEPPDANDYRHRRKMIELALGMGLSDEEEDDSLLDFEWDDTLLDEPPPPISYGPSKISATPLNNGTISRGSSADVGSSRTPRPERHPSSDRPLPPLYAAMSSPLPLSTDTPLPPLSVVTPVAMETPLPPLSMDIPLPPLSVGSPISPLSSTTPPPPLSIGTSPPLSIGTSPPPLTIETSPTQPPPLCLATSSSDEEPSPLTIEAPEEGAVLSGSGLVPVTVSRVTTT